jgi:hypothetical protein
MTSGDSNESAKLETNVLAVIDPEKSIGQRIRRISIISVPGEIQTARQVPAMGSGRPR